MQINRDYHKIDCGHCIKKHAMNNMAICKSWEFKQQTEDWKKEITENLQHLLEQINDIVDFLIDKD